MLCGSNHSNDRVVCKVVSLPIDLVKLSRKPHKRHLIARPLGRDMGCILWIQTLIYTLLQSLQWCMQYHVVLDRDVTAHRLYNRRRYYNKHIWRYTRYYIVDVTGDFRRLKVPGTQLFVQELVQSMTKATLIFALRKAFSRRCTFKSKALCLTHCGLFKPYGVMHLDQHGPGNGNSIARRTRHELTWYKLRQISTNQSDCNKDKYKHSRIPHE